ncbi:papain-like cysteine protease family protein [Variovorax sp. J22R115]|uniref:papain-like cysteine protease family protein n=1 Tax=Variovorax sp. J22R115 TaxID=3053509 RepID=UPI002574DCA2|nr:papain-like cysteine protease family protein [Variovorax sp. J22R115]MDM0053920.1 papain-like cysteine protease family protein [Variovorax sp. J22R115]
MNIAAGGRPRTRTRCWFGVLALAALLGSAHAAPVAIDHSKRLTPVDQGDSNLCWLASAAMMVSWKESRKVDMGQLAAGLGNPYADLFKNMAPASPALVKALAAKLALTTRGMQNFTPQWWIDRLRAGPIWVGGYEAGAKMRHVRVLVALVGDSTTPNEMTAIYVEPAGGKLVPTTFNELNKFFEAIAKAPGNLPDVQVLTFD